MKKETSIAVVIVAILFVLGSIAIRLTSEKPKMEILAPPTAEMVAEVKEKASMIKEMLKYLQEILGSLVAISGSIFYFKSRNKETKNEV